MLKSITWHSTRMILSSRTGISNAIQSTNYRKIPYVQRGQSKTRILGILDLFAFVLNCFFKIALAGWSSGKLPISAILVLYASSQSGSPAHLVMELFFF